MTLAAQQTSREAFERVRGAIRTKMHQQLYSTLMHVGSPMTSGELQQANSTLRLNSVSSRMSEMRKLGLVREGEPRECSVTGFKAVTYSAAIPTGSTGEEIRRRRSRKEIKAEQERALKSISTVCTQSRAAYASGVAKALAWVLANGGLPMDQETY